MNKTGSSEIAIFDRVKDVDLVLRSLDYMSQGVSVLDKDLCVSLFNKKFIEFLGFPEDFCYIGMPLSDVFQFNAERGDYGAGDVNQLVDERMRLARQLEPHSFERTRPNGVTLKVTGMPLPEGGFITTYEDVTDRHAAAEELRIAKNTAEKANRSKSHFLANISHELRTPLNAIIGFSSMWLSEVHGPIKQPKYKEYAEDIFQASTHLLNLIRDILDISQIEAGKVTLDESVINLNELMKDVNALFESDADKAAIKMTVTIENNIPCLKGDALRVKQMIINLLSNGIKFTPPDGAVSVDISVNAEEGIDIIITDTGIGIAENMSKDIFEPFTQIEESYNRNHDGVGLGLSIVHSLMEEHSGQVVLESTPGKGTIVKLMFPAKRSIS